MKESETNFLNSGKDIEISERSKTSATLMFLADTLTFMYAGKWLMSGDTLNGDAMMCMAAVIMATAFTTITILSFLDDISSATRQINQ